MSATSSECVAKNRSLRPPESRRSPFDVVAAVLALLLPLAYSPALGARFTSPKFALLLTVIPLGLIALIGVVRTSAGGAAKSALGFLFVAAGATLTSGNPELAFFGPYDQGTGLLFVLATIGAWAIGRSISPAGSTLVTRALLASFVVNALVAGLQHVVDGSILGLGLQSGRSTGLVGNPVHLAALIAGVGAMAAVGSRSSAWWLGAVVVAGSATQAAGSRVGVVVLGLAALAELVRNHNRRALAVVALVVLGAAAGQALVSSSTGQSSTSRVAGGVVEDSTLGRLYTWQSAPAAFADRPVLGWGPGRYGIASERHKPVELVRLGGDKVFVDAHNVFIEYAVTTGALGVVALMTFLVFASRGARGPLAAFALGVFLLLLVQPLHPVTAPLAALALGAAGPTLTGQVRRPRSSVVAIGSVPALAAAVALLVGDARVAEAQLDYRPEDLARARVALPDWPELHYQESLMWVFLAEAEKEDELYQHAIRQRQLAVHADPQDSRAWNHLGEILLARGDLDGASVAFREALARAPRFLAPRLGHARVAVARGDAAEANRQLDTVVALRGSRTPDIERIRSQLQDG